MSGAVQALLSGVVAALVSALGIWLSRRSAREANRNQQRLTDFQVLKGTVDALNGEVVRLQAALKEANAELDEAAVRYEALRDQLSDARYNVLVLSTHVRRYLPERPFPKLRAMDDDG